MKYLIVYAHPLKTSFNYAILNTTIETLKSKGHEVKVSDLYAQNFDPVKKPSDYEDLEKGKLSEEILREQKLIHWADSLVFVYPIWWTSMPAILKGYIDRVLTYGFAFAVDTNGLKGLLPDKKVIILNTHGMPQNLYENSGMYKSLQQTSDKGIFDFCGMKVVLHKFFASVPYITEADRKNLLVEVRASLENI